MPKLELTEVNIKNIMAIINASQIRGDSVEAIMEIKDKLKKALTSKVPLS